MGDLSQTKLSFWNDARTVSSKWWLTRVSKWRIGCLFEMTIAFSSKWWIACHFEMIDDSLFERLMAFSSTWRWCSLREMGLDALCCFRNDSHLSCHRRKMLCPVVFTFERIVYFEERPYIFGNDSWFRNESSRQKLSKSYHLIKIGNLVKIFALISYLKENHRF